MVYKPRPNPTNIPSQNPSNQVPYSDRIQPDVAQFPELQKSHPLGWGPKGAFVVSTYDSRPINCSDFLVGGSPTGTFNFPNPDDPGGSPGQGSLFNYTPPIGRLAILREWQVDIYFALDTGGDNQFRATSIDGVPELGQLNVTINIQIDNSDVPEYSNILYPEAVFGPIGAETFIVVPTGSNLKLITKIVFPEESPIVAQLINFRLYGNLLLATGENTQFEQATQQPIPVTTKRKTGFEYKEGS